MHAKSLLRSETGGRLLTLGSVFLTSKYKFSNLDRSLGEGLTTLPKQVESSYMTLV